MFPPYRKRRRGEDRPADDNRMAEQLVRLSSEVDSLTAALAELTIGHELHARITGRTEDADENPVYSGVLVHPGPNGTWVDTDRLFTAENDPLYEMNQNASVPVDGSVVVKVEPGEGGHYWRFRYEAGVQGPPGSPGTPGSASSSDVEVYPVSRARYGEQQVYDGRRVAYENDRNRWPDVERVWIKAPNDEDLTPGRRYHARPNGRLRLPLDQPSASGTGSSDGVGTSTCPAVRTCGGATHRMPAALTLSRGAFTRNIGILNNVDFPALTGELTYDAGTNLWQSLSTTGSDGHTWNIFYNVLDSGGICLGVLTYIRDDNNHSFAYESTVRDMNPHDWQTAGESGTLIAVAGELCSTAAPEDPDIPTPGEPVSVGSIDFDCNGVTRQFPRLMYLQVSEFTAGGRTFYAFGYHVQYDETDGLWRYGTSTFTGELWDVELTPFSGAGSGECFLSIWYRPRAGGGGDFALNDGLVDSWSPFSADGGGTYGETWSAGGEGPVPTGGGDSVEITTYSGTHRAPAVLFLVTSPVTPPGGVAGEEIPSLNDRLVWDCTEGVWVAGTQANAAGTRSWRITANPVVPDDRVRVLFTPTDGGDTFSLFTNPVTNWRNIFDALAPPVGVSGTGTLQGSWTAGNDYCGPGGVGNPYTSGSGTLGPMEERPLYVLQEVSEGQDECTNPVVGIGRTGDSLVVTYCDGTVNFIGLCCDDRDSSLDSSDELCTYSYSMNGRECPCVWCPEPEPAAPNCALWSGVPRTLPGRLWLTIEPRPGHTQPIIRRLALGGSIPIDAVPYGDSTHVRGGAVVYSFPGARYAPSSNTLHLSPATIGVYDRTRPCWRNIPGNPVEILTFMLLLNCDASLPIIMDTGEAAALTPGSTDPCPGEPRTTHQVAGGYSVVEFCPTGTRGGGTADGTLGGEPCPYYYAALANFGGGCEPVLVSRQEDPIEIVLDFVRPMLADIFASEECDIDFSRGFRLRITE